MKRINWTAALSKNLRDVTPRELEVLYKKASDWGMCACGNLCAAIPRDKEDGSPVDPDLKSLGQEFFDKVDDMKRAFEYGAYARANSIRMKALAIHNKIERRAAKLLAKLEGKS